MKKCAYYAFMLFLLFIMTSAVSCRTSPQVKSSQPAPDPVLLLQKLQWRSEAILSLDAEFGADVYQAKRNDRIKLMVVAERPQKIFMEAIGPVAVGTLGIMASNGEDFQQYDPHNNTAYFGPATRAAISRLLPFDISPQELIDLVFASPQLIKAERKAFGFDDKEGMYRFTWKNADFSQHVWFDNDGNPARVLTQDSAGRMIFNIIYRGYEQYGDERIPYPSTIRFETEEGRTRLVLKLHSDLRINQPVRQQIFNFQIPDGTEKIYLSGE